MNKYKIYVYAICKNEEKNIIRWIESMSEADGIYVLDTGSNDRSVELLKKFGVNVGERIVSPWRFDFARNLSLELVPNDADICVCTDIDEVFHSGWRQKVEEAWTNGVNRLKYRYTWSFNADGSEGSVLWISKIHSRNGYKWMHPVHEVLEATGFCKEGFAYGVQLDHHPDNNKPRSQYLPLLEMAVNEQPDDDRNMHYLGREYLYYGYWEKCIEVLKKHLKMKSATWREERSASMRYISKSYKELGNKEEAYNWALKAIAEAPQLREPWMQEADICLYYKDWLGVYYFASKALEIKERSKMYINESINWGYRPYDLIAVSSYYLGLYDRAYDNGKIALDMEPNNERLQQNYNFYKSKVNQNRK